MSTPSNDDVSSAVMFKSDRAFRVWRYGIGHSQLLLRAVPDSMDTVCLDLLFEAKTAASSGPPARSRRRTARQPRRVAPHHRTATGRYLAEAGETQIYAVLAALEEARFSGEAEVRVAASTALASALRT